MSAWTVRLAGLQRLSWPGRCGLLALAAGLCWAVFGAAQRETALAELQSQVAAQRSAALKAGRTGDAPATPTLTPDAAFLVAFPPLSEREARVMSLWQHAREHGIEPLRSEFRLSDEPALGLVRYRIVWPVSGAYAQLRGMIDAALAADRALSLDTLEFTRSESQPGVLKAQLVWSLWMRGPVGGTP